MIPGFGRNFTPTSIRVRRGTRLRTIFPNTARPGAHEERLTKAGIVTLNSGYGRRFSSRSARALDRLRRNVSAVQSRTGAGVNKSRALRSLARQVDAECVRSAGWTVRRSETIPFAVRPGASPLYFRA